MADDAGQPNAVDDASLISGLRGKLQYLRNQKTPSGLLPAEDKLIVAAVAGNTCTLGSGTRPKKANDERRVRGSFLCFLALGGDETVRVHHRGVDLKGAYIDKDLYLAGADCKGALQFRNCFFEREIVLEYAHLPMVLIDGSRVPGIKADLARIDGSIFLQKGFLAEGQVRLYNAHIGGDLDCRGGTFKQGDDGRTDSGQETALVCTTAKINGNVYLCERFRAKGQVRFSSARIGGFVDANDGWFVDAGKPTLVGRNISVGKSILLENARIMGSVDFYGASAGGELRFSNGRLKLQTPSH